MEEPVSPNQLDLLKELMEIDEEISKGILTRSLPKAMRRFLMAFGVASCMCASQQFQYFFLLFVT